MKYVFALIFSIGLAVSTQAQAKSYGFCMIQAGSLANETGFPDLGIAVICDGIRRFVPAEPNNLTTTFTEFLKTATGPIGIDRDYEFPEAMTLVNCTDANSITTCYLVAK